MANYNRLRKEGNNPRQLEYLSEQVPEVPIEQNDAGLLDWVFGEKGKPPEKIAEKKPGNYSKNHTEGKQVKKAESHLEHNIEPKLNLSYPNSSSFVLLTPFTARNSIMATASLIMLYPNNSEFSTGNLSAFNLLNSNYLNQRHRRHSVSRT